MEKQAIDKAIQDYMERNNIQEITYFIDSDNKFWCTNEDDDRVFKRAVKLCRLAYTKKLEGLEAVIQERCSTKEQMNDIAQDLRTYLTNHSEEKK